METEQIKQKIVAETTALMSLKVDNAELVKHTFRTIQDQVKALLSSEPKENETYTKALDLLQAAIDNEYSQFTESSLYEEKEQALIQLRHKASEVCEMLRTI